jgi:hypothetical protein
VSKILFVVGKPKLFFILFQKPVEYTGFILWFPSQYNRRKLYNALLRPSYLNNKPASRSIRPENIAHPLKANISG